MLPRLLLTLATIVLFHSFTSLEARAQMGPGVAADTSDVDSIDHRPHFLGHAGKYCAMRLARYEDSTLVSDFDLIRTDTVETLALRVLEPSGFIVTPSVIQGPVPYDTFRIWITSPSLDFPPGPLKVKLEARDANGRSDTTWYYVAVSARPRFSMPVFLSCHQPVNGGRSFQMLTFGIDDNATSGYEWNSMGMLDSHFCEFELPPTPPADVFDARWIIPVRLGTQRAIYPLTTRNDETPAPWQARFNAGGALGENYPVMIEWSMRDAQASPVPLTLLDPDGGKFFRVDMKTGEHTNAAGITIRETSWGASWGDSVQVFISLRSVDGFEIIRGEVADAPASGEAMKEACSINTTRAPHDAGTSLNYYIPAAAPISIEIADARGAIVRAIRVDRAEQGAGSIVWDERDDRGLPVASGLYICRLGAGRFTASCRLVVMR